MLEGLKVYISSTSVDLTDYRMEVISAMRKSGFFPLCMEDYVAQDKLPVDKCLADVAMSDLYVGIFAWRYGFVPPGFDKSITELEYRKAVEAGIPTLLFLLNENVDWPPEFCDTRQDAARISALREEMKLNRMISWFNPDPHQLASVVQSAAILAEREIHLAQRKKLEDLLAERYAEVSIADTPEQKASLDQALALVQEAMRQQSLNAQSMTRDPIPIQLPKLRGTFVDREMERDTLFHCLRRTDKRLVVVVAPGGYGKTELTTKVLKEIAPGSSIVADDVHGILYIRCVRGDVSLGQIFAEAGRIVGKKQEFCDTYAGKELTLARKLEYFFCELSKVGNVWLVMDNFEDLLAPDDDSIINEELREFLETAVAVEHNIRMIVTSRAVPRFKGSRSAEKIDLTAGLPPDQAIRYLREEGGEYGLADESDEVLRDFVQRVHCIPKALESILGFLEDHYPGITIRDILSDANLFVDFDRHDLEKGLKGLVAQQFSRLPADSQLVLSVISIFPKPVSSAALRYQLQGLGSAEFSLLLTRLEKNRLVSQIHGSYDLHPVVRSFVYGCIPRGLENTGEAKNGDNYTLISEFTRSGLHAKAAEFFRKVRKPEEEWKTIEDLEPHLQEIHHLIKAGEFDAAARVLNVIHYDYLALWGHVDVEIALREQLTGKLKDSYLLRHNALSLGVLFMDIGRVRESLPYLELSLERARQDNSKYGICESLGTLGSAFCLLGETKKSIEYNEMALMLSREVGDREKEEACLGNLGRAYSDLGELTVAIDFCEQRLVIIKELGNKREEGHALGSLSVIYSDIGKKQKAMECNERVLSIAREVGDRYVEGAVLSTTGHIWLDFDECLKAISCLEESLLIARDTGFRYGESARLAGIAYGNFLLLNDDIAVNYYQQALIIAREIENPIITCEILNALAFVNHYLKNESISRELYEESIALCIPSVSFKSAVLFGILLLNMGYQSDAEQQLIQGLKLCQEISDKTPNYYQAQYKLALCQLALKQTVDALDSYKKALDVCHEKGVVKMALREFEVLQRTAPNLISLSEVKHLLTSYITL